MQNSIDFFDIGITITFLELKEVRPPGPVQESFDEVINARIDKIKMKNDAESYKNEKIPEARGLASKIIHQANAYKKNVMTKAEGESERFLNELEIYKNSKEIIKKQLYLEFAKKIFQNIEKKYIVSNEDNKNPAQLKIFLGNSGK